MKTKTVMCVVEAHLTIPADATMLLDWQHRNVGFKLRDGREFHPLLALERDGEEVVHTDQRLALYGIEIFNYSETEVREVP